MTLRLVTWNINSVRLRIDNVCRLLAEWAPDVLCLQETKTPDELFPREAFEALGYRHMLVHGMKGYNGVAILSRVAVPVAWRRARGARAPIAATPSSSCPAASNCTTSMCRPAATSPIPRPTRNSPTSCSFSTR